jgi:golgin subfamily B member 1
MEAARETESQGPDKAVEAWRAVIADTPDVRAPRRELARVLREAERWTALAEALKDEEQKAAKGPADKTQVLRELVSVYREKLRQDMMAVNTLAQILQHDPKNLEVIDELAAQYESMKRWPDLVSTLAKKAEALDDHGEKVALHLRIANLYIERFSNQAEAIKAFEKVLELDPDHEEAIGHLMAVYEKRRDWEKLLRLKEREIDRIEDPVERAEKTYEVAKLAAARLKKPDVCTTWWARVLETDPAHEEALGELEKLYERGKNWEKLAEVCSKKAAIASDEKAQIDSLQKLGLLYTDKLEDPAKAIEAWRRLLDIDENHRRAQDAVKKLYVAERAWDELEDFYRSRGKIDEFVRVLERQVDQPDAGGDEDRLALAMKIAIVYRDELEKPDRAMRAFEKVLTLDDSHLQAAEALIPLYEGGRDPRKLVRVLEVQLAQTDEAALRQERIKYLAEFSEQKLRDKGAALGW